MLEENTYRSGDDGRYEFTITPVRLADKHLYIEVEATHPDYARKSPSGYALSMIRKNQKLGEDPFFSRVELQPAEKVSGQLLKPNGGPAAGVKVLVYSKAKPRDFQEYGSFADTQTDDQGRFTLNVCQGGPAVLWFLPQDFAPETHLLEASNPDVWKAEGDSGEGYAVFVADGEEADAKAEDPLKLTGKQTDLGEFSLSAGLRMRGRVLDQEGAPIPGVWVNAELRSGPAKKPIELPVADSIDRSTLTNEQGEFTMAPLPPGGYNVIPAERPEENPDRTREARPLPVPFMVRRVELSDANAAQSVELRAAETITIRTQNVDSTGKPTRGHGYFFHGRATEDGEGFYSTHVSPDETGATLLKVPKGLYRASLDFSTNEHGALRIRRTPGQPLSVKTSVLLGHLTEDPPLIEVVKYKAPILLVAVVDAAGRAAADFKCELRYREPDSRPHEEGATYFHGGVGDVGFEPQPDGRWRTRHLLPDEPFELAVTAPGYGVVKERYELREGETKEVEIVLPAVAEGESPRP